MVALHTVTNGVTSDESDVNQLVSLHQAGGVWADVMHGYGATGDGTTDDTAAIAAAIADAALNGGVVYFPAGTYITSPIAIPGGVILQGENGQGYYNATSTVPNSNTITTLKLKGGSAGPLLAADDGGANLSTHVRIRDINLNCNAIAQSAIYLADSGISISRFWRFERVYVCNVGNATYAVYIGNQNTACVMRECVIFNGTSGSPAGLGGVGWYGSDGQMLDCFIGYFSGTGLTTIGGDSEIFFFMRGGGIFTCTTGVVVGAAGSVFLGVSFDHNQNDGAYVGFSSSFTGCWFHTNSMQTNNNWSNLRIANAPTVSLLGCRASLRTEGSNNPSYHINADAGAIVHDVGTQVGLSTTFGTAYTNRATGMLGPSSTINFVIDGGGSAITTGIKGDVVIDFPCTIIGWDILADVAGAIVIDVWRDSYANFPPLVADTMPGAGKEPTIAATNAKAQDNDVTDWTKTAITAGDVLRFNVNSCATITRATLALRVLKT